MQTISSVIRNKTATAIERAFGQALDSESSSRFADIKQTADRKFGDYQCNNALRIAKELKQPPREVAMKILSEFNRLDSKGEAMMSKVEIAGPGFINFYLNHSYLSNEVDRQLRDDRLGVPLPECPQKVIVEFSSPNVAKELHVGHLRSTIIGDSIARIFEFLGHNVLRLNHIGDWGTQFGMLITYLQEFQPDVLTGKRKAALPDLMQWYRDSKKEFDANEHFKKASQENVVRLQSKDIQMINAWELICEISRRAYQEIYDLLDVKLTERGESFYNPHLNEIVDDLTEKGLIEISDGAKCIFLDGFYTRDKEPLPMIVQKSDGGFNYSTTDLAAMRHRVDIERADRIIVLTDAGQKQHFEMLVKATERAGYLDPHKTLFTHVPFGVVLGPDGKKFKTRSGKTERLIDLLQEGVDRAKSVLKERMPDLSESELSRFANILGIDSLKYADLSSNRLRDYVFSYDRMLRFEGNTAPFMLYAYVRVQGIKRKVDKDLSSIMESEHIDLHDPTEIELALTLRRFPDVLQDIENELLPNRLTDYLYGVAECFHAFFRDCRVQGSEYESSRLLLCELTARILEKGLNLLGIKLLPRM